MIVQAVRVKYNNSTTLSDNKRMKVRLLSKKYRSKNTNNNTR